MAPFETLAKGVDLAATPSKDARTGAYRYRLVYQGRQIFCRLDTKSKREAEALAYSIDRAIHDLETGDYLPNLESEVGGPTAYIGFTGASNSESVVISNDQYTAVPEVSSLFLISVAGLMMLGGVYRTRPNLSPSRHQSSGQSMGCLSSLLRCAGSFCV